MMSTYFYFYGIMYILNEACDTDIDQLILNILVISKESQNLLHLVHLKLSVHFSTMTNILLRNLIISQPCILFKILRHICRRLLDFYISVPFVASKGHKRSVYHR